MNKKLQKGIVAAVSAAMGTGMVAPIYAAAATGTGLDAQYKAAYDATVNATTTKDQKDLTAARVLVDGLYQVVKGTPNEYLATTLSSVLDPAQQVKLVELFSAIDKATASVKQADINAARTLILAMPDQWITSFSSAIDTIQQSLINNVNTAVVKAEGSKLAADKTAAQALIDDVKTVTNNADVASWANSMQTRVDAVSTAVTVSSVNAIAANAIKVTFNQAPADTSKVVFAVSGATGTAVTTTATWNTTNTEATLTSSYSLTPDTYSVNVKNDTADLGTSTVTISQQKVAKITVTSTVLSVVPGTYDSSKPTNNAGKGFATYKVEDQYGNDITNTPLGNNIVWTVGIGQIDPLTKNGLLVIDPINNTTPLNIYTSGAVVNGYDTNSYASTSANLTISMTTGTISDISLNKMTSPNNDDFNSGNTTGQWYLDYTALDASGNATTNYNLVNAGILQVNGGAFLNCTVVQDPADSSKAAISVQLNDVAKTLVADTQIPITILTTNGKSSTLTVTLKKQAALASFTMSAPTQMVASDETVNIPFTAVDQNGKTLTKYSDLMNGNTPLVNLTLTGGQLYLVPNADGTATLKAHVPALDPSLNSMTTYLMANVIATGKTSQITLNVQKTKAANSLSLDTSVLIPVMQQGATESIDFGQNYGGLTVNDQYGRAMDITAAGSRYQVIATPVATPSNTSFVAASSVDKNGVAIAGSSAYAGNAIRLTAQNSAGTQTVNFQLVDTTETYAADVKDSNGVVVHAKGTLKVPADRTIVDQKAVTFTVVSDTDINGYTLNTLATQYASVTRPASGVAPTLKDVDGEFYKQVKVYGTLAGGSKVALRAKLNSNLNTVQNVTVTGSDFYVIPKSSYATDNRTKIYGIKYDTTANPGKNSSTATVTVMVNGTDNMLHTLTATATSKSDSPVAQNVTYYADTTIAGLSVSDDVVTLPSSLVDGTSLLEFEADGSEPEGPVYFQGMDQYGSAGAALTVYISKQDTTLADGTTPDAPASINSTTGVLTLNGHTGKIVLTAVAANGMAKTITLNIATPTATDNSNAAASTALSDAATAETAYTTAGGDKTAAHYLAVESAKATVVNDLAIYAAKTVIDNDTLTLTNATTALTNDTTVLTNVSAAVAAVNGATAGTIGTVITTNAAVLGLDLTNYNKLTDKTSVQTALVGKSFADAAAVKLAFDNAVTAEATTLKSIVITTPPTKAAYSQNDTLNLAGLVVTGTYGDGSTSAVTVTNADVTGFDSTTAATVTQTLTVTVSGKTATFDVTMN